MDVSPASDALARGPFEILRTALRDGVDRYRALKDAPESRTLLLAAATSYIGNRLNTIALVALSYKLGDGALGVGGMLAIMMAPSLLLQPIAGTLVDRFPGKQLLIFCQVLLAIVTLSYILLTYVPNIWLLYGISFAIGAIQTVSMPAFEVRLMSVTPREKRGTANAVQMLAITSGEIIGPLLGGLILALAGVNPLFILNAMSFLLLAAIVSRLPQTVAGARADEDVAEDAAADDVAPKPGYRTLLRRPDVLLYTGMVIGSYLLFYGVVPLYIVRAHELGMGDGSVGIFYTVMGIGSLLGGVFAGMGTYSTQRALAIAGVASAIGAVSVILFGAAGSILLAMPLLIVVGMIGDIEEVASMTYFQNRLPEGVYGRFFSIFMMCAAIGGLGGSLLGPILAERFSTTIAFSILAIPVIILGTAFAVREGGLRFSLPPFAPDPEPEVAGHTYFRQRTPTDLLMRREDGRPVLEPRSHRLV